ncbi:3-oxoacyl-ACP synthase III [Nibricoccus sp. IMCC34717]|uniref:3-oxoacyl-ACP synthase III n=1 Tax=Nibricoccus sp. IMCC34717 TaxID=3034021 RepID=UPI00384F22D3
MRLRFENACLESIAVALPEEIWTSAAIEEKLKPLYERLRLPEGRLELMTGIRERRHWSPGTKPSDASAAAGRAVLAKSAVAAGQIGLFVHAAVCRDMMEPATASFAHRKIGLPATAQVFDVSNACLGFLNSLALAGAMIDSGQIEAALVVSGENGRGLIEQTLKTLNNGQLDRNAIKPYFANLTIGSGAVAAVVCHRRLVKGRVHRLIGGAARAATEHSELCQGDSHGAEALAMQTDSERMLVAGVELARETFADFSAETGWSAASVAQTICHQVGAAHRRKLYETLGLDLAKDFSTFETLGNMGSVSLPATLALALDAGRIREGDTVALLGIGSGLNCLMLGLEW